MLPDLFTPEDADLIITRIESLTPIHRRLWGKMDVGQMLEHLQRPLEVMDGSLKLHPSLFERLFGFLIKRVALSEQPFPHNAPTEPEFMVRDMPDFQAERTKLVNLVRNIIAEGREHFEGLRHPVFGKLTAAEWSWMQMKHMDHHLRQFGA